jgi:hypothetical protein
LPHHGGDSERVFMSPTDNDRRPDPDVLLARVKHEESRARRGRLKIFFGATAGVGKSYAMLEDARRQRDDGDDVVVGYVELHGRPETEALLEGLEILPPMHLEHRGVVLNEFDLDAALARHPQLLLVDELAHSNHQGARHPKRWQDIDELLSAGIDVYTTVNVQHLESLHDVVAIVALAPRVFEHRITLADARRGAEEDLQTPAPRARLLVLHAREKDVGVGPSVVIGGGHEHALAVAAMMRQARCAWLARRRARGCARSLERPRSRSNREMPR